MSWYLSYLVPSALTLTWSSILTLANSVTSKLTLEMIKFAAIVAKPQYQPTLIFTFSKNHSLDFLLKQLWWDFADMHKFIFFCLDILQFIWVVTIYGEAVTLDGSWTLFLQNSAPSLPPKSTTHMAKTKKVFLSLLLFSFIGLCFWVISGHFKRAWRKRNLSGKDNDKGATLSPQIKEV